MKTGHLTLIGLFRMILVMLFFLVSLGLGLSAFNGNASAEDEMNILIFIMGSDLEEALGAATQDIKEMMQTDIPGGTNVYLLIGGARHWFLSDEYDGAVAYLNIIDGQIVEMKKILNEACGTADSLASFIGFCTERSPSKCNALIFWGHGCEGMQGIGYDSLFYEDTLTLNELSEGLAQAGIFWDFLGFDACNMATFEAIWTLKDYTESIIATSNDESVQGWPYHELLSTIGEASEDLMVKMKEQIENSFQRHGHDVEICIVKSEAFSQLEAPLGELFDEASSVQMGTDLLTICEGCEDVGLTEKIGSALDGQCINTGIYHDWEAYGQLLESGMIPQYCKWILRCNGWER